MNSEIKERLIKKGLISGQDFCLAENESVSSGVLLEKVLLSRGLKLSDIGMCLSEIHQMPYVNLLDRTITESARGDLSERCARRWKAFPVDYDPKANLLTLAVPDTESAERVRKIYSFFLESHDLNFTVAAEMEIEEAINSFFGTGSSESTPKKPAPWPPKHNTTIPAQSIRPAENAEKKSVQISSVNDILSSLVSAVSMLVRCHLKDDEKKLEQIVARVRHCQLMAVRNNLSRESSAKLAMAAWFSGLDRGIIKQFTCPYNIENVIFGDGPGKGNDVESLILVLVRCYQNLEEDSPELCRDISQVRRNLHVKWSDAGTHRDLLEAFLQVLMDEQFLDKFSDVAGVVLVVDATGTVGPRIKKAITDAGYKVAYVSSMASARVFARNSPADIIILNINLLEKDALEYCREIKSDPGFGGPPLIVLHSVESDVRAAEYLRAGADDLIAAPVDMELLYLKIEKQLAVSARSPSGKGVSGSLAEMSFSDMLQVLSAGVRSMDIAVSRNGEKGRVVLKEGNVIHAEAGSLKGEQAFYELMKWHEGDFSMKECSEFPEQTVTSSTMSLLMEGARLDDESSS